MSAAVGMSVVQKTVTELMAINQKEVEEASKYGKQWKELKSKIQALQKEHLTNAHYQGTLAESIKCLRTIRDIPAMRLRMITLFRCSAMALAQSTLSNSDYSAIRKALVEKRFDAAKKLIGLHQIPPDFVVVGTDLFPHRQGATTALGCACWAADMDMINWLLAQARVDVNYGNEVTEPHVMPALFVAACSDAPLDRKLAVIQRLIDAGANVLARNSRDAWWLDECNMVEMQPEVWQLLLESIREQKDAFEKNAKGADESILDHLIDYSQDLVDEFIPARNGGNFIPSGLPYISRIIDAFRQAAKMMVFHGIDLPADVSTPSAPSDPRFSSRWQWINGDLQAFNLAATLSLRQRVEKTFVANQKGAIDANAMRIGVSRECFRQTFGHDCSWWTQPAAAAPAATAATAAAAVAAAATSTT